MRDALMRQRLAAAILLAGVALASPATAQTFDSGRYRADLLRLSQILGELHHLRALCSDAERQLWRDEMTALLQHDNPTPERKNEMIGAFNAGYAAAQRGYGACDERARAESRRLAREAASLSRSAAANIAL